MLLVIDKNETRGAIFCDVFYLMGIITERLKENSSTMFLPERYLAVIIVEPQLFTYDDIASIRERYRSAVFVSLTSSEYNFNQRLFFDRQYKIGISVSKILEDIKILSESFGITPIGTYRFNGLDASSITGGIYFNGKKISLTKTEAMILKSLIISEARGLYAREILPLAFRQSKIPDISNIRTHICIMNKKFKHITGKKLIENTENGKYKLSSDIYEFNHSDCKAPLTV